MSAKAENKRFINPQAINLKSFMKGEARRKKEKNEHQSFLQHKKQTITSVLYTTVLRNQRTPRNRQFKIFNCQVEFDARYHMGSLWY